MPRVLLLLPSTSYRAREFLAAAAALGADVVVGSDHRQLLGTGAGALLVDLADTRRGLAQIFAHDSRHPLDAVVGTDDESVLLAAAAACALGLAHNPPASVAAARDKHRFRQILAAAGLPGPRARLVDLREDLDAVAASLTYPCVVKPRSLSGSRGVIRVDAPHGFVTAARRVGAILAGCPDLPEAAHRHTVLVEGYVPGAEVALDGLLDAGRLEVLALMDKPDPMHGPFFEETVLVTPSRLPEARQRAVAALVESTARALGLRHGAVHAELRIGAAGESVIELAPRSIGGLCSRALALPGGRSLEEAVLAQALGIAAAGGAPAGEPGPAESARAVMMIPVPGPGRLEAVGGLDAARAVPGVDEVVLTTAPGEPLVPLPEGGRYLGFIFAHGRTPGGAERSVRDAHARIVFEVVPRAGGPASVPVA